MSGDLRRPRSPSTVRESDIPSIGLSVNHTGPLSSSLKIEHGQDGSEYGSYINFTAVSRVRNWRCRFRRLHIRYWVRPWISITDRMGSTPASQVNPVTSLMLPCTVIEFVYGLYVGRTWTPILKQ